MQGLNDLLAALAASKRPPRSKSQAPTSSSALRSADDVWRLLSSAAGGRAGDSALPRQPRQLQNIARQLQQLSPELAVEWHDRAVKNALAQVRHHVSKLLTPSGSLSAEQLLLA